MQPDTGWSTGQRALLRFLEQQGVLTAEPAAPATGKPSTADLFAAFADAIDQQALVDLVSQTLRIGTVDLDGFVPMADLVALIPVEVARRGEVVPVAQYDGTLEVAASNPLDLETVKSVEFTTGLRVRTKIARRADVCRAVVDAYGAVPGAVAPETAPQETAPVEAGEDAGAPEGETAPEPPPCDVDPEPIPGPVEAAPAAPAAPADAEPNGWSFEGDVAEDTEAAEVAAEQPEDGPVSDDGAVLPDDEADAAAITLDVSVETDPTSDADAEGEPEEPSGPIATPAWTKLESEQDEAPVWSIDDESLELGVDDVLKLGLFDDVRLDDPATPEHVAGGGEEPEQDASPDAAIDSSAEILVAAAAPAEAAPEEATEPADPEPERIAIVAEEIALDEPTYAPDLARIDEPAAVAAPGPGAATTAGRPAVLVVSRDLARRVALRDALESDADAPCVLTMRDEIEARAAIALGRLGAIVVEGGALGADGRPLWQVLRETAARVVVWGGRPIAPDVVGLDRDTNVAEVAAQVRALLEESSDG